MPELGGRVLDTQRRPVPGAQIKLMDENGDQLVTTSSASDGSFSFQHKVCETCTLQVVPDGKSSF
ncbi:carboxypeptidase-like regulatory domain-containing protein, partial [Acinetobacter baumannii]